MANSINGFDQHPHGYEFTVTVDESIADSLNLNNVVLRFTYQTETPTQEEIWRKRTEYQQQMQQAEEVAMSDMYLTLEERNLRGY